MEGKTDGVSSKILSVILGILILTIFCLIIWIIIRIASHNRLVSRDNCLSEIKMVSLDEAKECLSNNYIDHNEEVLVRYQTLINEAYAANDFELFINLLISRSSLLSINGECDKALELLRDNNINQLEDGWKMLFYGEARGVSLSCNNEQSSQMYLNNYLNLLDAERAYDESS